MEGGMRVLDHHGLEARVAELEAEIEHLQRELRIDAQQRVVDAMRRRYRLQPARAALVATLYAAAPRSVSTWALLEAIPSGDHARERSDDVLKVHICFIRRTLGAAAIETVHRHGYRLTPAGQQQVVAALAELMGKAA
jgi:DNA-binding response OmpR family regulator